MAEGRNNQRVITGLPWSAEAGENRRFGVILALMVVLFLPPALLIPALDVPEIERSEAEKIPPQLARLVEQPAPKPEVAAPLPEPEPEPEPEQKPEPEPEPEQTVAEKPEPKVVQPPIRPQPVQPQSVKQAREKASRSGLLAMKDKLASLREPAPVPDKRLRANIGTGQEQATTAVSDPSDALQGSGGVKESVAPDTRVAVADHQVKHVEAAPEPVKTVARAKPAKPSVGERAMSNIRQVFNAQKTALYSLYRRELRQDPSLEGKVLLELVIEPDGSVSACKVVSSELENPALEQRIAMRVRLFNFGADNVETRKVRFPVDFLPG
jgi:outer membrane biosynthesis protein TonB